jgi:hypothetical protein
MPGKPEIRYAVDAVFSDGQRVMLAAFTYAHLAGAWVDQHTGQDFYPGRVYRLEIVPFEVDHDHS